MDSKHEEQEEGRHKEGKLQEGKAKAESVRRNGEEAIEIGSVIPNY